MNKLKSVGRWLKKSPLVKAFVIWVIFLFVVAIVVDKLAMPIFAGAFSSTGEVPNLEGMTEQAAESALTDAGFKYEWVEEGRYSSVVPSGNVLVQMPAAGRVAKLGRTVKLTKSLGLRVVKIPDLRGKSQKQAEISLTRAGLVCGEIVKGAHQSIPRGVVIRTVPLSGKNARVGDTVKVVISAGAKQGKTLLPDFAGETLDNVRAGIAKLGFKVGEVRHVKASGDSKSGSVVETVPKDGDYLPHDTEVDIVIAD